MIKSFLPTHCPACGYKLIIEQGDKSDTLKLMCKNPECSGSALKKLQKGIIALEIKGLGPKIIEKLLNAGITSSVDLFNPDKFNEETLIASGEFQKGRSLEKIMASVKSTESIPVQKAILSLQLDKIGKTFSEKIGLKLSGLPYDFSGLELDVREELKDENSELNKTIKESLEIFEKSGVEIKYFESKKFVADEVKKITKIVDISGFDDRTEVLEIINKLGWDYNQNFMTLPENCQLLIVPEKNTESIRVTEAKEQNVKIMTLKQVKLVFV